MTGGADAYVELGSTGLRMVILDGPERTRRTVDVDLGGQRLTPTGTLSGAEISGPALDALRAALDQLGAEVATAGAVVRRAVGTAAAREATNADALATIVSDALGVELEVVDAGTEARLVPGRRLDGDGARHRHDRSR